MSALHLDGVTSGYGRRPVIHGISLSLHPGRTLAVLGANGAGKTTLARTISGLVRCGGGSIRVDDQAITGLPPERRISHGVAMVPEGRGLFGRMTVLDNLKLGAYRTGYHTEVLDEVVALFPVLGDRLTQVAQTLSGGEQQMVAIGRALMSRPRFLVLDEPSLGLAPKVMADIGARIGDLTAGGMGVLLIEQNARLALEIADDGVVIERGRITLRDSAAALSASSSVVDAYLGGVS